MPVTFSPRARAKLAEYEARLRAQRDAEQYEAFVRSRVAPQGVRVVAVRNYPPAPPQEPKYYASQPEPKAPRSATTIAAIRVPREIAPAKPQYLRRRGRLVYVADTPGPDVDETL